MSEQTTIRLPFASVELGLRDFAFEEEIAEFFEDAYTAFAAMQNKSITPLNRSANNPVVRQFITRHRSRPCPHIVNVGK